MKTEKVLEVVLTGVVTGLTLGVGYALSQKLMGKFGTKEVVVVNEKSEVLGTAKQMCKDMNGRAYPCGSAK